MTNWGQAIGGVAVAAAIAFGAISMGKSLIDMRRADRTVVVKGLAEREVEANIAFWRIPFRADGDTPSAALRAADRSQKTVVAFLEKGGVPTEEIAIEPYSLRVERSFYQVNGEQQERVRYVAIGAARLRTAKVEEVVALSGNTRELLDAGVLLGEADYSDASKPEYVFTTLNTIKPDLIKEATEAARASAAQFAEDSGATVGDIATANQGVVQILPRDGQFDQRAERYKIVRVVTTVRYYLND